MASIDAWYLGGANEKHDPTALNRHA